MTDTNPQDAATCPVDHKSREAWLSQARSATGSQSQSQSQTLPPDHPPVVAGDSAAESCPVDHKARQVWTQQAQAASSGTSTAPAQAQQSAQPVSSRSWTSSILSYLPFGAPTTATSASSQNAPSIPAQSQPSLDTNRVVSSIPRTTLSSTSAADSVAHALANKEQETGADERTGNWIYPSQKMFFDAMKRKGHDPHSADMQTIVPIHNAVNERAWAQIKEWEEPYVKGTSCDGPRLSSFSGLSTKMSPKAKVNTWLGYQAPFDRHDWIVDRCGQEIEYVIDFYTGRPQGDGRPSFYLDVRPKLNSWEGIKMRAFRGLGLM